MRRLLSLATMLTVAFAPAAAGADPSGDVLAAAKNFSALRYWHADEVAGSHTIAVDFAAPDRFRLQTQTGTQYMIGSDMYISAGGRTMKIPMPGAAAMIAELRSPGAAANFAKRHAIRDLGTSTVGGVPTHAYGFDDTTSGIATHNVLDVGPQQLPYRMTVDSGKSKVTVRYSRWNVPVTISPPA